MKNIKNSIYNVISKEFSVPIGEIADEKGPGDISGWDSIGQLRLIMSIEQTFNYQLSVDEVVSINSVKDIIDIISNSLAQGEEIENKFGKHQSEISIAPIRSPVKIYGGPGSVVALNSFEYRRIAIVTGDSKYSHKNLDIVCDYLSKDIEIHIFKKIW